MRFVKVNVNPKRKKTGDCVIRAIVQATCLPYEEVAKMMFDASMESGYAFASREAAEIVLMKLGFTKHKKPFKANRKTYSVGETYSLIAKDEIAVLNVANHFSCVKGDKLIDLWDCSRKSIYGYYTRKAATPEELKVYGGEIEQTKEIGSSRTLLC